jgi:hypothetical protein
MTYILNLLKEKTFKILLSYILPKFKIVFIVSTAFYFQDLFKEVTAEYYMEIDKILK